MRDQPIQSAPDPSIEHLGANGLSVVAHNGGWAVKYRDSFLGVTAALSDALSVVAALAEHAGGSTNVGRGRA